MQHTHFLALFLSPLRDAPFATDVPPGAWSDDDREPERARALAARNRDLGARLRAAFPFFAPIPLPPDELADLPDYVDGDDAERVIRRLHRFVRLSGRWSHGFLEVRVCDRRVEVDVALASDAFDAATFPAALAQLLSGLEGASGMPLRPSADGPAWGSAAAAARDLVEQHRVGLRQLEKVARRSRWLQRLGPASGALLTLLALVCAAAIVADAVRIGTLAARTDPGRVATFVTSALPLPENAFWVFPRYVLDGWVDSPGQPIRLKVYRDEYLRAAPGARYTVLSTRDRETPWVLRSDGNLQLPRWEWADRGIAVVALVAVLPVGVWLVLVARPWWRGRRAAGAGREAMYAAMTRRLLNLLGWGAVVGVLIVLKGFL